jgi:hypothetical protein
MAMFCNVFVITKGLKSVNKFSPAKYHPFGVGSVTQNTLVGT